jgi:hypothetical protein
VSEEGGGSWREGRPHDLSIDDRDTFCKRDVYFRGQKLVRVSVFMNENKTKRENERAKKKKRNLPPK